MIMSYSSNLLFQKKYFPEIYKSYLGMQSEAHEGNRVNAKKYTYLYFYLDSSVEVIQFIEELFAVDLGYYHPLSLCEVRFGYEKAIYHSENCRVIFYINHPYLDINQSLIFSNNINYDILKESRALYTYMENPFKQLTDIKIKRCCQYEYESHNLKSREEFLRCIYDMKPMYAFEISSITPKMNTVINSTSQATEVSIIVIRTINESIDLKEDVIIKKCCEAIMNQLTAKSVEILCRYMMNMAFSRNFIITELYFSFERDFKEQLEKLFRHEILPFIRELKGMNNDYAGRYNAISENEKILNLNSFMEKHLKALCDLMEDSNEI